MFLAGYGHVRALYSTGLEHEPVRYGSKACSGLVRGRVRSSYKRCLLVHITVHGQPRGHPYVSESVCVLLSIRGQELTVEDSVVVFPHEQMLCETVPKDTGFNHLA